MFSYRLLQGTTKGRFSLPLNGPSRAESIPYLLALPHAVTLNIPVRGRSNPWPLPKKETGRWLSTIGFDNMLRILCSRVDSHLPVSDPPRPAREHPARSALPDLALGPRGDERRNLPAGPGGVRGGGEGSARVERDSPSGSRRARGPCHGVRVFASIRVSPQAASRAGARAPVGGSGRAGLRLGFRRLALGRLRRGLGVGLGGAGARQRLLRGRGSPYSGGPPWTRRGLRRPCSVTV